MHRQRRRVTGVGGPPGGTPSLRAPGGSGTGRGAAHTRTTTRARSLARPRSPARARSPARHGGPAHDGGQLLVLAGVVLVLALIGTMLAVSHLTGEQQQSQTDPASDLQAKYLDVRSEMINTLTPLIYEHVDNGTALMHFRNIQNETETKGRDSGLHTIMRLGNATDVISPKSEYNFTEVNATAGDCGSGVKRKYNASSFNNSAFYLTDYDCVNDGLIYDSSLGRLRGIVIHLFVADHRARMDETIILATS